MLKELVHEQQRRVGGSFRVPHFSIQKDHLHLIVEAEDRTLARGIRSFVIAFARKVNRLLRRKGRVWGDRYHRRDLGSPRQVRNALAYVLNNDLKHGVRRPSPLGPFATIDIFSSAPLFNGWSAQTTRVNYLVPWTENMKPRTWGLAEGWKLCGLIDPRAIPGPRPRVGVRKTAPTYPA